MSTTSKIGKRDVELTASDVGAMAQNTGYITGTIKEFVKSLKGNASGMVAYSDVSDASSEIPDGFLLYNRTDGFSGFVYFMAFYMGRFKFGHYDTTTDEINWGYGSDSFLPLTGGTLNGRELFVFNGYGKFVTSEYSVAIESFNGEKNSNDWRNLTISNSRSTSLKDSALLCDMANGVRTNYQLYGKHNKPSGSYTGNGGGGGSNTRVIKVNGIGEMLLIRGNGYNTLLSGNGGVWWNNSGETGTIKINEANFGSNGEYALVTGHASLNANGVTYTYRLL